MIREKSKIIKDKLKDEIINDIWTLFKTEGEKKYRKKEAKRKNNQGLNN